MAHHTQAGLHRNVIDQVKLVNIRPLAKNDVRSDILLGSRERRVKWLRKYAVATVATTATATPNGMRPFAPAEGRIVIY